MKINFLSFGFCLGLALGSFFDGETSNGLIQLLCALSNIPGMLL